jgi:ABC-type ATPase involved in cell division
MGSTFSTAVPSLEDTRWLKNAVVYGPNASGKSSLLDALRNLADLVRNSAKVTDPKEPIKQIEPFALAPSEPVSPTAFAVTFVGGNVRFEYRVAATRERVWHESLRAFPKVHEQVWFSRDWNAETQTYLWSPDRPVGFQRDSALENYTLPNGLFLSKAIANNKSELEPVYRWFTDHLKFLDLSGRRGDLPQNFTMQQLVEKTPLASNIVNLLRRADIGVTDAAVLERQPSPEQLELVLSLLPENAREGARKARWLTPELSHRGPGQRSLPLPWESESAGTHRVFAVAGPWLDILNRGYVVCIDELETSMHPIIVRELLRLFASEKENTNGAQLIMTTHNPLLLDPTLIRRDQVWFSDKDEEGSSHLYPLTDYQPRQGESLVRGYLAGRYGAVPFIPEGLLGSFDSAEPEEETAPDA